ncbi:putative methyltransferase-domain-containing protein [Lactarius akahatsu]|uniref:Methyltransferase-domain-containing protein n=1 Tax=Lactarius akahatsu TaxID=416441 RepID=A0AAD4LBB9_9AGAM|nr:putative methyltransferase-domain-containing protein [Lactarius akahatsu]
MTSDGGSTASVNTAPPGPITLPQSATLVSDPDDEIFFLYTRLATLKPADSSDTGHFHGLGSENSNQDALLVRIELKPPTTCELQRNTETGNQRRKRRKGGGVQKAKDERGGRDPIVLEYVLLQDKTALRSRSGDTGSVLWKTSIEFLSLVLQQRHFPERRRGLFDYEKLSQAHVLELGAGTGLLALALSPFVRKYTATDIPALVPLLRKNILSAPASAPVTVAALDWTLPAAPNVLLVVDCVYHPALVRPLLTTLTALATPQHTAAVVVVELRAEDVLREFLQEWIALGWRVWSVGEDLLGARWGMWVGWRET